MLYLSRKIGESIIINDTIELTVVEVRGKAVKLGFTFPANASILRKELHEKIAAENRAAASADLGSEEDLVRALTSTAADDAAPATPDAG